MPFSRDTIGLLLGLAGVVIFGATLPMTRIAVVGLDPWFVTMGRAALAGAIALGVLIGAVILRAAVSLANKVLGSSPAGGGADEYGGPPPGYGEYGGGYGGYAPRTAVPEPVVEPVPAPVLAAPVTD